MSGPAHVVLIMITRGLFSDNHWKTCSWGGSFITYEGHWGGERGGERERRKERNREKVKVIKER